MLTDKEKLRYEYLIHQEQEDALTFMEQRELDKLRRDEQQRAHQVEEGGLGGPKPIHHTITYVLDKANKAEEAERNETR